MFVVKYNVLIFEDRKFVDIGNIVKNQYFKGLYYIVEWVDLVNVYVVFGDGVINGFKEVGLLFGKVCLLIGEMSFKGILVIGEYISLLCLVNDFQFVYMIFGVQFSVGGDNFG